jgi:mono/diheme cytochrome c family protein
MRMRRILLGLAVLAAAGGATFWVLTEPRPIAASEIPETPGDPERGEVLFWAGGCASCHAGEGAAEANGPVLAGGKPLVSPFGTFYPQNISPDPETGIGNWTNADFVNAMKRGLAPGGRHLYPAFPYTSYQRMPVADLIDLKAFLGTLPAVNQANREHDLPFPLNIRRGIGLWKLLFLDGREHADNPAKPADINRGDYLVNGPGHCNECHTPRTLFGLGGLDYTKALGGAPNPTGRGRASNITPGRGGIGDESAEDLLFDLQVGADFGGLMAEVQKNLAHLSEADLAAIIAYLKQTTPVDSPPRGNRNGGDNSGAGSDNSGRGNGGS